MSNFWRIDREEILYIEKAINNGLNGKYVSAFEDKFSKKFNTKYSIALNSGTSLTIDTPTTTIADGTNDFDIASHDGSNGLKLGGSLVTANSFVINGTTGRSIAMSIVFGGLG